MGFYRSIRSKWTGVWGCVCVYVHLYFQSAFRVKKRGGGKSKHHPSILHSFSLNNLLLPPVELRNRERRKNRGEGWLLTSSFHTSPHCVTHHRRAENFTLPSEEWSRSPLQTTGLMDTLDLHAITQGHGAFGSVEVKAPQTLITSSLSISHFVQWFLLSFFVIMGSKSPSFHSPTAWSTRIWGVWRSSQSLKPHLETHPWYSWSDTAHNPAESRVPGGALLCGLWNNASNGNVKEDVNARRFPRQHHDCHHSSIFTGN